MDAVFSRPTWVQVSPPSVERYTPEPHEDDWRLFCSPEPAQMIFESPAKMARSPKTFSGSLSSGLHEVAWFVVYQTPPVAAAM
jgi:hypothetical protein